ncbi:hypothetical protein HK096_002609 [Nowakowskiella sp. JEL0078]|nr:hypothetical protein HK096_002609 [Nowakowskiella sp. JEL0078]
MWSIVSIPLGSLFILLSLSYERHPLTGRGRFMFVDEHFEFEAAETEFQTQLNICQGQLIAISDPRYRRLNEIIRRILEPILSLREWEVFLINDDQFNAFVLSNGKIFVYTGLIDHIPSNDHLAAVLSHEIAHVLSRHSAERIGVFHFVDMVSSVVHAFLYTLSVNLPAISDFLGRNIELGSNIIGNLSYSRMCEAEADAIGIYLMALAGFNPETAVDLWSRFNELQIAAAGIDNQMNLSNEQSVEQIEELFSSHPSHSHRALDLRENHLDGALSVYSGRISVLDALRSEVELPSSEVANLLEALYNIANGKDTVLNSAVSTLMKKQDKLNYALHKVLTNHLRDAEPLSMRRQKLQDDLMENSLRVMHVMGLD